MENFIEKFIEEANEHIAVIESSLLEYEKSKNEEDIERIFRAVHTLKGTGAMFGYNTISELTHNLENIFDLLRKKIIQFDKKIIDITLKTTDYIKNIIENKLEDNNNELNSLIEEISSYLNYHKSLQENYFTYNQANKNNEDNEKYLYYIFFKPGGNVLKSGLNILNLINELSEYGSTYIVPNITEIPEIDKLDPINSYISWHILLFTNKTQKQIEDIFLFVIDESILKIERIGKENLIENKKFIRQIDEIFRFNYSDQTQFIYQILQEIKNPVTDKIKKILQNEKQGSFITSIKVASEKLDNLINLVSELVITQSRLSLFAEKYNNSELLSIVEGMQKLIKQLRDLSFDIVLVPINELYTRFNRHVRDLLNELNKKADFVVSGLETELDKTIIEQITDPIMHILRNCIDHGIETPEERIKLGKSEKGTISMTAYYSGNYVHIVISDDGRGIDEEEIRKIAIEKGIITEDTILSKQQIYDLLFIPGFSTSKKVTEISGRGVGMDVVKQKLTEIRGEVKISSEKNKGTTIELKIPLTLSIIDGLLVNVSDLSLVIPLSVIDKICLISNEELIEHSELYVINDESRIPVFNLREQLGFAKQDRDIYQMIVVNINNQKTGLIVDYIVGEYQAVLKPLGKFYQNLDIFSAATILGDGSIALVLDINRAIENFSKKILIETI